jgi:hypothetical protein
MKTETTEELLLYAQWCERLAKVATRPELAAELRAMSRELYARAEAAKAETQPARKVANAH